MWKKRAEFIVENFHPKKSLDIGCSFADLVSYLHENNVDSYGIDGSEYVISQVSDRLKNRVHRVNFNYDKFPFEDDTFDFVSSFHVIEHVTNIEFFAKELKRVMKPGARGWFITPNWNHDPNEKHDLFMHKFPYWKKTFGEFGFRVEKFNPAQMLTLRSRAARFRLYKLPQPIQRIVKRILYDCANIRGKEYSFVLLN